MPWAWKYFSCFFIDTVNSIPPPFFFLLKQQHKKLHNGAVIVLFPRSCAHSSVRLFAGISELLQILEDSGNTCAPIRTKRGETNFWLLELGKLEAGQAGLRAQPARVGVPLCLESMWEAGVFSENLLSLPGLVSHILGSMFFDSV